MPFYCCSICDDAGRVVAEEITVVIEETERGGEPGWYGTVTITHLAGLQPGQQYDLVLPDGRRGRFTVRRNTFAGGESRAVAIHGIGPLR